MDLRHSSETIEAILKEVEQMDEIAQQSLLIQLKARHYLQRKHKPIAQYDKASVKPLSMKQIDEIKHRARKKHAG
ncbi:MAG: hypothetical protein SH856_10300 [Flavobacteriales bacterium]|nr:hypothetical protein [Flavobacteriales bacterium]